MIIVNSNVLYVIFQTCWACVFVVPVPGVKDRSLRACVREEEEEASQLLQKRGKDRFKASKLHNFIPLFLLRLK